MPWLTRDEIGTHLHGSMTSPVARGLTGQGLQHTGQGAFCHHPCLMEKAEILGTSSCLDRKRYLETLRSAIILVLTVEEAEERPKTLTVIWKERVGPSHPKVQTVHRTAHATFARVWLKKSSQSGTLHSGRVRVCIGTVF